MTAEKISLIDLAEDFLQAIPAEGIGLHGTTEGKLGLISQFGIKDRGIGIHYFSLKRDHTHDNLTASSAQKLLREFTTTCAFAIAYALKNTDYIPTEFEHAKPEETNPAIVIFRRHTYDRIAVRTGWGTWDFEKSRYPILQGHILYSSAISADEMSGIEAVYSEQYTLPFLDGVTEGQKKLGVLAAMRLLNQITNTNPLRLHDFI